MQALLIPKVLIADMTIVNTGAIAEDVIKVGNKFALRTEIGLLQDLMIVWRPSASA